MPAVLLYFRLHQPFRLRKYTVFDTDPAYFDARLNPPLLRKAAETAYLPLLRLCTSLLQPSLADPHAQPPIPFKVAFSVTGTLVEQLERHAPEVLHLLHTLAQSPHVEFLAETYHHSLAALRSPTEFIEQVNLHRDMLKRNFNILPTTFRNTELIYSNDVARLAAELGFPVLLAEGYEPALDHRSAAFAYTPVWPNSQPHPDLPSAPPTTLLLRNHQLSEALAFHLSDPAHPLFPLTPDALAQHIATIGGPLCNLFLPAEALSTQSTLLDFLTHLPAALAHHHCPLLLPKDAPAHATNAGPLDLP
ncbi:MAG TPA: hypothetical protein VHQ47_08130, partial [Phycisphaerae bacterium]|nr:hypothetical protein [Phycisphaerae bacterium]